MRISFEVDRHLHLSAFTVRVKHKLRVFLRWIQDASLAFRAAMEDLNVPYYCLTIALLRSESSTL